MNCVLHHAHYHDKIMGEIARVLKRGGKFLIIDLMVNNPIIELGRRSFRFMPRRIQRMFPDDPVVERSTPERLKVDFHATVELLCKSGFSIDYIEHGQLFFFVFDWLERITYLKLSKTRFSRVYIWILKLKKFLFRRPVFVRRGQLLAIGARRTC